MFCLSHRCHCVPRPVTLIFLCLIGLCLSWSYSAHCDEWVYETGDLRAVWGSASTDVFAVGKRGLILHYNGTRWKPMYGGTVECGFGYKMKDIWGSSATDIYAVGCYDAHGEQLESCRENNGAILHYDGTSWEVLPTGIMSNLTGLWGSSASDIVAVGEGGAVYHFDGNTWTPETSNTTANLTAVWGASGSDLFAVGSNGTILHYNGMAWSPMTSGTTSQLNDVWGLSGTNVFAVGAGGTVLHYNGSDWQPPDPPGSGTTEGLYHVWGSAPSKVFAAGSGGTILRFNGSSWTTQTSPTAADLIGLWGSSANNIFAVGDRTTILRYNGSSWNIHSEGISEDLNDIWGTSDTNVFAVGSNGTIIRYSGSGWKKMDSGISGIFHGVWGSSGSNIYAVSSDGNILLYNGSNWTTVYSDPAFRFFDVWGTSENNIYVVGEDTSDAVSSKALRLEYDGSGWASYRMGMDNRGALCVWGNASTDIYISTDAGYGEPGLIRHYDGSEWSATPIGGFESIHGFWGGGTDDIHAVGDYFELGISVYGIAYYFNGSAWQKVPLDLPYEAGRARLKAIWGRSADDVITVGSRGQGEDAGHVILRNTGGTWWFDRYGRSIHGLDGVWGDVDGDVFAVGDHGVIMRLPSSEDDQPSSGDPWAKTFGEVESDRGNAIAVTRDGGYIAAGETRSFGGGDADAWIVKFDVEGAVEWEKRYGGTGYESASRILKTRDGGFMVAGETGLGAGGIDVWMLKLDGLGNIEWEKAYGGTENDRVKDIQEIGDCHDTGYVVLANTASFGAGESDIWVFRLDSAGNMQWEKRYGGASNDYAGSLVLAKNYGFAVAGETHSFDAGNGDYWLLRLDENGDALWQKAYGLWSFVPPDHYDHNADWDPRMAATRDGGFILAGTSKVAFVNTRCWILKLDAVGNITWQKLFETYADYDVSSIQQTEDRGYLVGGTVGGAVGSTLVRDAWLMKLDKDGNEQWQGAYGGSNLKDKDDITQVRQVPDGTYVATGQTFSADYGNGDMWVLKLDELGDIPDCAALSKWHGGSIDTAQSPADTAVTVTDTDASVETTSSAVHDTEAEQGDACLSELGDLIDVPKTGQTLCYNGAGDPVACEDTGQDGDVQAGVVWPSPRFVDKGDGTIQDNLTGLVWLKDANYVATLGTVPEATSDGRLEWTQSLDFVADMNAGVYPNFGYTDWRAPNMNEIESLFHAGVQNPAEWLVSQGFINVPSDPRNPFDSWYWSSTPHSGSYIWRLDFLTGTVETGRKIGQQYTWPVRLGQWFHPDPAFPANLGKSGRKNSLYPGDDGDLQIGVAWPSPRFKDHEDGTVTDQLTGLMWLKDANCFGAMLWPPALDTVNQFNLNPLTFGCHELTATYRDWRLPNRKEFPSLIDYNVWPYGFIGRLPLDHPFENLYAYNYWTSTTDETGNSAAKNGAYSFNLAAAIASRSKRFYNHAVWPVRGGPKCYGDCDGDGDVDGSDLALFMEDLLTNNLEGPCSADFNEDGLVNEEDSARFATCLGRTDCPVLNGEQ